MSTEHNSIPAGEESGQTGRGPLSTLIRWVLRFVMFVIFALLTGWAALAIYYSNLPAPLRTGFAVAFIAGSLYLLLWVKPRILGRLVFAGIFAVVVASRALTICDATVRFQTRSYNANSSAFNSRRS